MSKYKVIEEKDFNLDYQNRDLGFVRKGSSFMVYLLLKGDFCEETCLLDLDTIKKIYKNINKRATRCKNCKGSGTLTRVTHPGRMGGYDRGPCPYCNGAGEKAKKIITNDFEFNITKKQANILFKEKVYLQELKTESTSYRHIGSLSEADIVALLDIL